MSRTSIVIEGIQLHNVHDSAVCEGRPCVIHNPSDHHMRGFRLLWRDDRKIFERVCPHGIGHPDPDQFHYWRENDMEYEGVHGCDGCCRVKEPDRITPPVTAEDAFRAAAAEMSRAAGMPADVAWTKGESALRSLLALHTSACLHAFSTSLTRELEAQMPASGTPAAAAVDAVIRAVGAVASEHGAALSGAAMQHVELTAQVSES